MTTPEDTFRRLKRAPIQEVFNLLGRRIVHGSPPMNLDEYIQKCKEQSKIPLTVAAEFEPYLEGTGWTIDELNQELQRMYDQT